MKVPKFITVGIVLKI